MPMVCISTSDSASWLFIQCFVIITAWLAINMTSIVMLLGEVNTNETVVIVCLKQLLIILHTHEQSVSCSSEKQVEPLCHLLNVSSLISAVCGCTQIVSGYCQLGCVLLPHQPSLHRWFLHVAIDTKRTNDPSVQWVRMERDKKLKVSFTVPLLSFVWNLITSNLFILNMFWIVVSCLQCKIVSIYHNWIKSMY